MTNGQLEMPNMDDAPMNPCDEAMPVRYDARPENVRYRDEGCDLSPSCLNCRLPVCRYDCPFGTRRLRTLDRDEEIVRLRHRDRLPIDALADRFHVSRRTVFRILRRCLPSAIASDCRVGRASCPPGHEEASR